MIHEVEREAILSRRDLLVGAAAAAGINLAGRSVAAETAGTAERQGFRFVHLTDIHVQPELRADEGFRKCMAAVHELKPRPDFILTGGDLVMDVLDVTEERARMLFDLFLAICRDSDIPVRYCIGNHEVFGWESKGKISPDHVSYGKKMVQERLDMPQTSYSFIHKGWHFCVVDNILPDPDGHGYLGGLNEEGLDWLSKDLAAAGDRPKVVCAHIPFVSVAVYRRIDATDKPHVQISRSRMCRNPGPILQVIRERKVNLVLTGHLHENERLAYNGTTFIGEGAVSGAWWKGPHLGNAEGFGIIDVKPDGTFEHRYMEYGWKAEV